MARGVLQTLTSSGSRCDISTIVRRHAGAEDREKGHLSGRHAAKVGWTFPSVGVDLVFGTCAGLGLEQAFEAQHADPNAIDHRVLDEFPECLPWNACGRWQHVDRDLIADADGL